MLKRYAAVLSALVLGGVFVWYRATEAPPAQVLPSSKVGRALEMRAADWPASPAPTYRFKLASNPDLYTVVCSGTKHLGPAVTVKDVHCVKGLLERP